MFCYLKKKWAFLTKNFLFLFKLNFKQKPVNKINIICSGYEFVKNVRKLETLTKYILPKCEWVNTKY